MHRSKPLEYFDGSRANQKRQYPLGSWYSRTMVKRTSTNDLDNWDDAQDIDHLVQDKRSHKRATPAKGRRRNRRYENRLLRAQLNTPDESEFSESPDADPKENS